MCMCVGGMRLVCCPQCEAVPTYLTQPYWFLDVKLEDWKLSGRALGTQDSPTVTTAEQEEA